MTGRCDECYEIDKEIQFKVSCNPLGYNEFLDRMDYRDVFFFCSLQCMNNYSGRCAGRLQSDPKV